MINLQNYEEWFLLYIDKELSTEQAGMVDDFVLQNPALKEELDLLIETILSKEEIAVAQDWNVLLKTEQPYWQTQALSAIDDELQPAEYEKWQKVLSENKEVKEFYETLQYTKLPSENIVFENKEILLKNETKVVPLWLRYASIAAAILGVVFFAWNFYSHQTETSTTIFFAKKQTKEKAIHPNSIQPNIVAKNVNLDSNKKKDKAILLKKYEAEINRKNENVALNTSLQEQKTNSPSGNTSEKIHIDKSIVMASQEIKAPSIASPNIIHSMDNKPLISNAIVLNTTNQTAPIRSGKRFVMLEDKDQEKMYIASTEINTKKIFGWLKKNKFGKSKDNSKKVEIANFEISIKTNDL